MQPPLAIFLSKQDFKICFINNDHGEIFIVVNQTKCSSLSAGKEVNPDVVVRAQMSTMGFT